MKHQIEQIITREQILEAVEAYWGREVLGGKLIIQKAAFWAMASGENVHIPDLTLRFKATLERQEYPRVAPYSTSAYLPPASPFDDDEAEEIQAKPLKNGRAK